MFASLWRLVTQNTRPFFHVRSFALRDSLKKARLHLNSGRRTSRELSQDRALVAIPAVMRAKTNFLMLGNAAAVRRMRSRSGSADGVELGNTAGPTPTDDEVDVGRSGGGNAGSSQGRDIDRRRSARASVTELDAGGRASSARASTPELAARGRASSARASTPELDARERASSARSSMLELDVRERAPSGFEAENPMHQERGSAPTAAVNLAPCHVPSLIPLPGLAGLKRNS